MVFEFPVRSQFDRSGEGASHPQVKEPSNPPFDAPGVKNRARVAQPRGRTKFSSPPPSPPSSDRTLNTRTLPSSAAVLSLSGAFARRHPPALGAFARRPARGKPPPPRSCLHPPAAASLLRRGQAAPPRRRRLLAVCLCL
jgi:hypothetical protein